MTKRLRVPVVVGPNGLQPAAPTYSEVPHGYAPTASGKVSPDGIANGTPAGDAALAILSVLVDVPDEDCTPAGDALDPAALRRRYPNHWLINKGP